MKEYITSFIYFINNIHYLKELSKHNNEKTLIGNVKHVKQIFLFQILLYSILSIFLYNSLSIIFNFKAKYYINFLIIILSIFYYYIFNCILSKFTNCYNYFIELCEIIVKYDNIIKNKIKIQKYIKNIEEDPKKTLLDIINTLNNITKKDINKKSDNYDNKDLVEIFKEYQKLKSNLFKYIFDNYEKEYIGKEKYIYKYINYILSYNKSLDLIMKHLKFEFNKNIKILNKEKFDYDLLIKEYEKYITNNILKSEELEKNELKNTIYDLLISNYKLNENFIELIKEIDSPNSNNDNNEKLIQMVEKIIEKKQISISVLEQFKKRINFEEDKNNQKENQNIKNNNFDILNEINNSTHNEISFYDINLSNININKSNLNKDKDNKNFNTNKKNSKSVDVYDIINEEEKIKDLKASFIDEINDYCKKIKGLKNEKEDIKKDNNEKENKPNYNFEQLQNNNNPNNKLIKNKNEENNSDMSMIKLDFAKSLTMALGNNKNLKLNVFGDNEEMDK